MNAENHAEPTSSSSPTCPRPPYPFNLRGSQVNSRVRPTMSTVLVTTNDNPTSPLLHIGCREQCFVHASVLA